MKKEFQLLQKIDSLDSLWRYVKKPQGQVSFDNSWSHEVKDVELYFRDVVRYDRKDKSHIFSKFKIIIQEMIIKFLKLSRLGSGKVWFYFYFSKKFNFVKLRNKNHYEVEAYNDCTDYMPLPLDWMNDESALYYSQTYLRFFIKNFTNIEYTEKIEMSLYYFEDEFKKLEKVTQEQINLAEEIIEFYKVREKLYWESYR